MGILVAMVAEVVACEISLVPYCMLVVYYHGCFMDGCVRIIVLDIES